MQLDFKAEPTVGEVLRDHVLEIEGITQEKLAGALKVSRHSINELLNDRRAVTATMALRLARALGTTPTFWMNLQRDADLQVAARKLQRELEQIPVLREPQDQDQVVVPFDTLFGAVED